MCASPLQAIEVSSDDDSSHADETKSLPVHPTQGTALKSSRPHASSYHGTGDLEEVNEDLLSWFDGQREKRGMPWRQPYNSAASMEEKGQRAYEVWVSEVMLQQTQVSTVIAFWRRWLAKWPTIADLATANVEEVNAAWKGLGYYRRARSLLTGAQKVMSCSKFDGRLPSDPLELEKEIDGVGRYTAGAICSIAYGVRTPIVDGNIHRLLTRTLAIHAPQAGAPTVKSLWESAASLVKALPERPGIAGDWNQALMELGSTVCKPTNPDCTRCPIRAGCRGYKEMVLHVPITQSKAPCSLCVEFPDSPDNGVTVFPMKKTKAAQREEHTAVCVLEWNDSTGDDASRRWLLVKRPEKGLLAGLYEYPSATVPAEATAAERTSATEAVIRSIIKGGLVLPSRRQVGVVKHVFSHIRMSYIVEHVVIGRGEAPPAIGRNGSSGGQAAWLSASEVQEANVGASVSKVWAAVYPDGAAPGKKRKAAAAGRAVDAGRKVVRVAMPAMPVRSVP